MLVDVPEATFKALNGTEHGLRDYFIDVVAPQLPACNRATFIHAANTQVCIAFS